MVWLNQRHPQTLVIAQVLLYLSAFFALLDPPPTLIFDQSMVRVAISLLLTFGAAGGAFGIANSKKWGYYLGIAAAFAPFLIRFRILQLTDVGTAIEWNVVGLIFDVALVAALLHRQSGEYQRVYFE